MLRSGILHPVDDSSVLVNEELVGYLVCLACLACLAYCRQHLCGLLAAVALLVVFAAALGLASTLGIRAVADEALRRLQLFVAVLRRGIVKPIKLLSQQHLLALVLSKPAL